MPSNSLLLGGQDELHAGVLGRRLHGFVERRAGEYGRESSRLGDGRQFIRGEDLPREHVLDAGAVVEGAREPVAVESCPLDDRAPLSLDGPRSRTRPEERFVLDVEDDLPARPGEAGHSVQQASVLGRHSITEARPEANDSIERAVHELGQAGRVSFDDSSRGSDFPRRLRDARIALDAGDDVAESGEPGEMTATSAAHVEHRAVVGKREDASQERDLARGCLLGLRRPEDGVPGGGVGV